MRERMLCALSIRSFVLIDRLDLQPGPGFTALTGETGAGKSILLDALGLALGGPAEKRFLRAGADQASVTAAFEPDIGHPVWAALEAAGVEASPGEGVVLKRVIRRDGPARAMINDQPVSAALLAAIGERLVEIHAQHAASALMRVSEHRNLLDQYAGNGALLEAVGAAWTALQSAEARRRELAAEVAGADGERVDLEERLAALVELAPEPGEAERLAAERGVLMVAERVAGAVEEARAALEMAEVGGALSRAGRALDQAARLIGEAGTHPLAETARQARDALERAVIEVDEGVRGLDGLGAGIDSDPAVLETVEARLFALRAAARREEVEPEGLSGRIDAIRARLEALPSADGTLAAAEDAERSARARWYAAAETLSAARRSAAQRLEKVIAAELRPLKLGQAEIAITVAPLAGDDAGRNGQDKVEFEARTNPGAPFGPLRKIASGGELARVALALKCALAEAGEAPVLVFDEADQGVGGAVSAAIGERLARLGRIRQVFAVTHAPQVAAAGDAQWCVTKQPGAKGLGRTEVSGLDERERCEEIARMLSGTTVTAEARAAAARLLEVPCPQKSP